MNRCGVVTQPKLYLFVAKDRSCAVVISAFSLEDARAVAAEDEDELLYYNDTVVESGSRLARR